MSSCLNDLLRVGSKKAIGYLPIETIKKNGFSYLDIMISLNEKGIETRYFSEEKCKIKSGALFAFDIDALAKILKENQKILLQANWPIEVDIFINHLIGHTAKPETDLFRLLEKVYGK